MTRKAAVTPLRPHEKYERLIATAKNLPALATAVAHPCDETSLRGALEAAQAGMIVPTLVGPKEKICNLAGSLGLDLEGIGGRMAHAWGTLLPYVRSGKPAYEQVFGRPFWEDLDAHPEVAASFDALIGPGGHGNCRAGRKEDGEHRDHSGTARQAASGHQSLS